jgi:arylsulfatase A-like enzyme
MKWLLQLSVFLLPASLAAGDAENPNVVVILADDMGYGDVQALNPKSRIPTPHLNKLASDGMTFTDAHTGSAVCTPTRYGLLTGRYCWRSRLKSGVLFPPRDSPLIEDNRVTIASYLKSHGYRTACIGKWHLGIGWARDSKGEADFNRPFTNGPVEKGFDRFFGIAASLDMVPYVFLDDHQAIAPATETQEAISFPRYVRKGPRAPGFDPGEVLDQLAAKAREFIMAPGKENQPFFLYLPLTAPHKPVWPHPRFVGKTELGPYGDFVHQVDATVGAVLAALEESGRAGSTMVIYTSDNGSFMYRRSEGEKHHLADETDQGYRPDDHTANFHWRGTKADIWEGGHRVPFFVRWRGKVAAGSRCDTPICLTDVFATVANVVGHAPPEGSAEDSFSLLPELSGTPRSKPRPPVIHHSASGHFAIRKGDLKLVLSNGSGGREAPRGKAFQKPYRLYDLAADPGETKNLIGKKPGLAAELEAEFEQISGGDHLPEKK